MSKNTTQNTLSNASAERLLLRCGVHLTGYQEQMESFANMLAEAGYDAAAQQITKAAEYIDLAIQRVHATRGKLDKEEA